MSQRILAIDDDTRNLKLIRGYLSDTDYQLSTAVHGIDGWNELEKLQYNVDAILLDRMMPKMDGIEFLEKLKQNSLTTDIPVIMQTAAAEANQIKEGIDAGAYYYLTKPYQQTVLKAILCSALEFRKKNTALRNAVGKNQSLCHLMTSMSLKFSTLKEADQLTTLMADLYPDPKRVVPGLSELLINAVEHGNLGISYQQKTDLNLQGQWLAEVERRLTLPENQSKQVLVEFEKGADAIKLTITDEGNGFDWKNYMEMKAERAMDSHGRGIAMANMFSFDELTYQGCGNQVSCKVFLL
jgi:CheY-like chemotaxis protein/anti-sigma regulatory factor (Ser/Thr protein kinase)